jgi:hypothetical protein
MSFKKWWALVASSALLGAMAVGSGCSSSSSSNNNNNTDAATEGGVIHHIDSGGGGGDDGGGGGGDGATGPMYDMTTGKQCKSDTDCKGAAGTNVCSIDYNGGTVYGVTKVEIWPTPVCLPKIVSTGNCDPAPSYDPTGSSIHFCDGPDNPSSPGICIPNNTQMPSPGQGICLPKCSFAPDGTAATGCVGHNTCVPFTFVLYDNDAGVPTPPPVGYGFCQGSCQQDSDCGDLGANYHCQVDIGFCTTNPVVRNVDAGNGVGGSCTNPSGGQSTACFCAGSNTTGTGYCTSACVVGGNACPDGYTCDNGFPGTLSFGDAGTFNYTKQTQGSVGTCFKPCTMADAATGCPPNSTCQNISLVGPDCIP